MKNIIKMKNMWTIENTVMNGNYWNAVVKDHPKATNNGYVLLHRVIVENELGRLLSDDEVVHHINEDKLDNRIENLQVMSKAEHTRLHRSTGRTKVQLKCPWCGELFARERRQTHLVKRKNGYTCCSRKCSGKISTFIKKNGITVDIEAALLQNVQD